MPDGGPAQAGGGEQAEHGCQHPSDDDRQRAAPLEGGAVGHRRGRGGLAAHGQGRQRRLHARRESRPGARALQRTFHEDEHALMQEPPAARQPLGDGVLIEFERRRDPRDRLVFAVEKHQRLAIGLRQLANFAPEQRDLLIRDRLGQRGGLRRGQPRGLLQRLRRVRGLAAQPAPVGIDAVPGDAAEPRAELPRFAQRGEALPGDDKSLLRQVLTLAHVARGAEGQRADQGLVALDDPAKRPLAARHALGDQLEGHSRGWKKRRRRSWLTCKWSKWGQS